MISELQPEEIEYYARQLILPAWDSQQQLRLKKSMLLIPDSFELAGRYLAGAGIGDIAIYPSSPDTTLAENLATELQKQNPYINVSVAKQDTRQHTRISFYSDSLQSDFDFPVGKTHFGFCSAKENVKVERHEAGQLRESISLARPTLSSFLSCELPDSILASAFVIKSLGAS